MKSSGCRVNMVVTMHPIDHGWAWMVMIGAHVIMFLFIGSFKCMGLFFVEFRELYGASAAVSSITFGVMQAGLSLLTPIATATGERIGHRYVAMTGGVLCASASFLTAFAPNIIYVAVVFGGLTALGFGCIFSPGMVMVSQYFSKRRSLANGIAFAGTSMGTLTLPLLIRYTIDSYGIRGTLMIYSGVLLHICVGASLFRPVTFYKRKKVVTSDLSTVNISDLNELSSDVKESQKEENDAESNNINTDIRSPQTKSKWLPCCHGKEDNAKPLFDWSIFKCAAFITYVIGVTFINPGYLCSFIFFPPYAEELGFSKQTVSTFLSVIGLCDLCARITCGWFADLNLVRRHNILGTALMLAGLCSIIGPFFPFKYTIMVMMVFVGMFGACFPALMGVVMVDLVGLDKMPNAIGLSSMIMGLCCAFAPPVLGMVRDIHGSFGFVYHITGLFMVLGAVAFYSVPLAQRIDRKRRMLTSDSEVQHTHEET